MSSKTHPSHIHVHLKACQAAASIVEAATGFNFWSAPLQLATYFWQDLRKNIPQNTEKNATACKPDPVQIYFHTFHGQRFLEKDIVDVSICKSRTQQKNQRVVRIFIQLGSIFHFVRWVKVVPYFICFVENLEGDLFKKSHFIHMFR